jgi:hypothetical protein
MTCAARGCENEPLPDRRVCADCAPRYDKVRESLDQPQRTIVRRDRVKAESPGPRLCRVEDCIQFSVRGSPFCHVHDADH